VGFTIRHLGISKVRGRFAGFDGDIVVGGTLETTTVTATVELATVDTGNADRDAHVLQPDLLDVERRPTMTFRSTGVRPGGDSGDDGDDSRWQLDGELTIGEVTWPVTLAVVLGGIGDHPMGGPRHAGFEAIGEIRRSDYGLGPQIPAPVLGDVVKIELDLQLLEPAGS
jgi:polyisoprenoid-binding protein YceI